jgi:hypothetical protein
MTWDRAGCAAALSAVLAPALPNVTIHLLPPEIVNPFCVVVSRPQSVSYITASLGCDEATLPLIVVGGVESEDQVESIKGTCRSTIDANPQLGGAVQVAWCAEERNWRNLTGAGGIQLLLVELVLTVRM